MNAIKGLWAYQFCTIFSLQNQRTLPNPRYTMVYEGMGLNWGDKFRSNFFFSISFMASSFNSWYT